MKKKLIIISIIILVLSLVGGISAFFIIGANEKTVIFDDEVNADDYKYKTTLKETPNDGTKPTDYDSLTNVYYALYNLEHKEAFSCTTTGTAKASVATQIISNSRVVIGDEALVSTISDGIVKVGTQKYFVNNGEKVLLRSASSISDAKASWNDKDNPECITTDAYIKRYGWLPYKAIGYIICDDTVLNTSQLKCEDGIYEVTLTLDPDGEKAPYWYRREVATNGSSTMIPEFSLINLTYKFDEKWNVIEVHAQEKYLVKSMGIKTTCETNCYDSYSYDNVSFDSDSYKFFQKYKDIEAHDNNDDTKVDALTMLTSSLLNKDSSESLGISILFNDKLVEGLASIDISDLENIKLKVKAEDLYVEYTDKLYISLGNLKLKSDTAYLKELLNEFNGTIPNVEAIDTAGILAAFDNASIKEENNESIVNVNFNLLGFDISLEYSIYKDDVDYILNYARINSLVNGNKVEIEAKPSSDKLPIYDKSSFKELNNIEFVFDFFSELIINKKAEAKLNINYENVNATIDLKADLAKLAIEANLNLKLGNNDYLINLIYLNDNIFISFNDINLMISKADLIKLVNKYLIKDSNINNLDATNVLTTIMTLDYNKLLKEVVIDNNSISLKTNLEELIGLKNDIAITLKNEENNINISLDKLNINGNISVLKELNIELPDKNYSNLIYLEDFIDQIVNLIENKKIELNLNAKYQDINIKGIVKLDLNDLNNIKANANLSLEKNGKIQNIDVTYLNDLIYLDIKDIHLSISKNSLMDLLKKFDIDFTSNISILDNIFNLDFNKIIKALELKENNIELKLDLSDILSSLNDLNINLFKEETGLKLSADIYDLNAYISSSDFEIAVNNDYESLDNIISFADIIKNIIDEKHVSFDVSATISEFKIKGNINLDFNDQNNIKAYAKLNLIKGELVQQIELTYLDNNIYLDICNNKFVLSKDALIDILKSFDVNLESNIDLDKIFEIDLEKIINNLEIAENKIELAINLGDILASLSDLNIVISKIDDVITIELNKYNLKINSYVSDFVIKVEGEYQTLDNIKSIASNIKSIIDNKKLKLAIDANNENLSIDGNILIDFNSNVKAQAKIDIDYKGINIPLNAYYFSEYDDYQNIIFIEINNIHGYITLEDLMKVFDFEMIDPIDLLMKLDYESLIKELIINQNSIDITVNINDLLKLIGLDLELNDINANINILDDKLNIKSNLLEEFNIDIYSDFDDEIKLENDDYINLNSIISNAFNIFKNINKKSFRLEIDADLNISNFVSLLSKDFNIDGYVDFLYDEGYKINANLNIQYDKITTSINIKYVDDYLYINALGIDIKLGINELDSLINELKTKFEIDDSKLDISKDNILTKALDVIQKTLLVNENTISIDLNGLFDKLSILTIMLLNNNGDYSLNLNMDILNCDINLKEIEKYDLSYSNEYLEYDEILNLCDMIVKILDIAKNKEFNLNLDLSIYDSGKKHLDIDGSLKFKIYDNGKFDLHASGTITQYEANETKYHILDLYLISKEYFNTLDAEDMVYITYGTILNSSSKIKVYLPLSEVLDVAGTVSKLLGVDLSFLDKYSSFNFNDIDTTQVTNLIKDSTEGKNINLDNIIKSFVATSGRLELGLNISDFLAQPENNNISLIVDTNESGNNIASLSLKNLYTTYNSIIDNTMIDINEVTLVNEEVDIKKPDLTGYYDLSDIDNLVNGLITTATFKDFEINASAKLNMGAGIIDLITLPINVKVHVNDDGTPIIHTYIDASSYMAKAAFGTKKLDIYFKDDYVYIKKLARNEGNLGLLNKDGDTYYLMVSQQTFLDDIVYYLLEFGLGAKSIVMDNVNGSSNENHVIDAGKVLSDYSSTSTEFYLALSLEELTGNSMLGDLSLTLGLTDVITNNDTKETTKALTYIKNLNVKLLGIININIDEMSLTNISDGKVNAVDLSQLNSYIEEYSYPIDKIYKKNSVDGTISHKITFVKGLGEDNVVLTGIAGEEFTKPTVSDVTYKGVTYKFVGWYSDKQLTEEFTLTKFDNENYKVYAKYVEA